jgi:hypothetical protein
MGLEKDIIRLAETIAGLNNIHPHKEELFKVHNDIHRAALSRRWILKLENPSTLCCSCIVRTRDNFWKFYHFEYKGQKSDKITFVGRVGGGDYTYSTNFTPKYNKI